MKQKKMINRGKGFNANYNNNHQQQKNKSFHTAHNQQQQNGGGYRSYHTANHSFRDNLNKSPYQRPNNHQRRPKPRQFPSFNDFNRNNYLSNKRQTYNNMRGGARGRGRGRGSFRGRGRGRGGGR